MGDSTPDSTPRKDRRLYAKFDIGMDEHTKIMFLSDAAFRALFESTLYSRRQLTDGFLDERVVLKKWGAEVAAELSSNDTNKPSWRRVEGGWHIHDFAEHQTTTQDIEKKREAGRRGGLAKAKQEPSKTEAPAKHVLDECSSKSLAKTETETETETETSLFAVPDAESEGTRERPLPKSWAPTASHIERAKAQGIDVISAAEDFRLHAATHGRTAVSWNAAFTTWLKRAKPTTQTKPAANSPWSKDFYK